MIIEFPKILKIEYNKLKKFFINKENDLYDKEKINFYYISLKFIFKSRIYIYYFQFLLNARIIIIEIINKKHLLLLNGDIKDKLEFIIKCLTDSNYYYIKYLNYKKFASMHQIINSDENIISKYKISKSKIIETINPKIYNAAMISSIYFYSYSFNTLYSFFNIFKIIDKHNNTSEFTKIINNIFFSIGTDNKIYVYNDSLHKIDKIILDNWTYNIECREPENDNKNLSIIVCTKNEIYNIYLSKDNLINNHLSLKKGNFNFLVKINNNQFLICEEKFISMERRGFNIYNTKKCVKCIEGYYREGIKLNDNLVAFTSNEVVSRGEDKLIIYNILKEKIVFKKSGYSYILSSKGLCIIENQNDKILLCACKKYIKRQKNGIFLINLNFIYKNTYETTFIDTEDFEVHCFSNLNI